MHIAKIAQLVALGAIGAQASSPASQDNAVLEARAPPEYTRPADLFKFNWHIPKIPTMKELLEPSDRYKNYPVYKPSAKPAAGSSGKQSTTPPKKGKRSPDAADEEAQEPQAVVEARSTASDLFKFNWHVPKIPTMKELLEPSDRYKNYPVYKPQAKPAAGSDKGSAAKPSTEKQSTTAPKSPNKGKRAVAWTA